MGDNAISRVEAITRTGERLAAQIGAVFVVNKRKVSDFHRRAEALDRLSPNLERNSTQFGG